MKEKNTNNFKDWLINSKGLEIKSARDVVSRLNRANSICDLNFNKAVEKIIFDLNENTNFNKLSLTVKSQLRRAIRLYKEHQN